MYTGVKGMIYMIKPVTLSVYGAETLCARRVNMPSAKDTFEWLEARATEISGTAFSYAVY